MSKRQRRQHTTEHKVAILHRHLVDKVPVSDLCNEYKLQPGVFYHWLKQAMENLGAAGERQLHRLVRRPPGSGPGTSVTVQYKDMGYGREHQGGARCPGRRPVSWTDAVASSRPVNAAR